jgi:hypothetical protein
MPNLPPQNLPRPGPYFSTSGPLDGPILGRDEPPAMGLLVVVPGSDCPFGLAYPAGLAGHGAGPAVTFRLVIDNTELPGRWLCIEREFVQLDEVAEKL